MFSRHTIARHLLAGLVVVVAACARSATAQTFTFDFDENGNGTINGGTAAQIPLISLGNIVDPFDPSSGIQPLAYNIVGSLPGFPAPVDGDVVLGENTGVISDVLRFYHGLLMVYSDLPEVGEIPPLADVGFSPLRQGNQLGLPETGPEAGPNGLFGYAPLANQPGAFSAPTVAVYNFTSDAAVPEPTSFAVLGLAALALLIRRRKPTRDSAAV